MPNLADIVSYSPYTGVFRWRISRGRCAAGAIAGTRGSQGYVYVKVDGKNYLAHRLAWFFTYGKWVDEIDHRNRDRSDNRLANLREATRSQNNSNTSMRSTNTSGLRGVSFDKSRLQWRATITFNGTQKTIGRFATKEAAAAAYLAEARRLMGEFVGDLQ
jgi:hypothetical protein